MFNCNATEQGGTLTEQKFVNIESLSENLVIRRCFVVHFLAA